MGETRWMDRAEECAIHPDIGAGIQIDLLMLCMTPVTTNLQSGGYILMRTQGSLFAQRFLARYKYCRHLLTRIAGPSMYSVSLGRGEERRGVGWQWEDWTAIHDDWGWSVDWSRCPATCLPHLSLDLTLRYYLSTKVPTLVCTQGPQACQGAHVTIREAPRRSVDRGEGAAAATSSPESESKSDHARRASWNGGRGIKAKRLGG